MFCGECGTQNPDTNQFCKNCGKPLARRQAAARSAAGTGPAYQPAPVPAAPQSLPAPAPAVPASSRSRLQPRQQHRSARWNWLGIVSMIPGILSSGILPLILGLSAILLGIAGHVPVQKSNRQDRDLLALSELSLGSQHLP